MKSALTLPTRNLLTGAVVNWDNEEEMAGIGVGADNLTLSWKELSVYRRKKHQRSMWSSATYEEVKVLHDVSGIVSSGNLVAIMGSSGAGKTTLLAAISRRDKSAMTGYLMLNGRLAGADLISRISGFVPQQDLAIEDLTVKEHMDFMARLMMDKRATSTLRRRRIQQLLADFGILNCSGTKLKDLSGGERKRVSLAVQLLNDPPILFCDEPTTGLDSWSANAVVSRLRALATGGKLVVCSVHQPASGVFELFHQIILLANGKVAFHGTIDQAQHFFGSLNYKCPIGFNAAEYFVSLLGIHLDKEMESRERIRRICDEFRRSDIASDIEDKVGDVRDEFEYFNGSIDTKNQYFEKYLTLVKVNCFVQFYWLMWRNIKSMKHSSSIWIIEFVVLMFVGLVISVPYIGHFEELDQRDIQNVEGLLYLAVTETIFLCIYSVFITFPSEVPILLRETANGLYSPGPYYLSKMIFWIPRATIEPVIYATLIFLVAGLHGGFWGWFGFSFICVLCANYANAYGHILYIPLDKLLSNYFYAYLKNAIFGAVDYGAIVHGTKIRSFLSAVFDKMETAALVSVPFDLIGTMFSGIYLNLASASPFFSWLKYISGFYYGVEAISILQWDSIQSIKCVEIDGMPCIKTGHEVLKRFGFDENDFWRNCGCLLAMYCIGHFIAYIMVIKRSRGTPVY